MKKILVFGSNIAGRHTKGVALRAYKEYGAIYGEGSGLHGNSYAIPVKDEDFKSLPLNKIQRHVDQFLRFAKLNPDMTFDVTRIGCEYLGYEDKDIAPMFTGASKNCQLPVGWRNFRSPSTMFTL